MNMPLAAGSRHLTAMRISALAALLMLGACRNEIDLHTGLTDADANQVVAALRGDGLQATKRPAKGGVTVSIPEAELARATAVLSARGLPHHPATRMGDVFKKEGLISSPLEERARYISALSQELETTLAQIDGVVVARVHVVLPEKVAPGEPVQPPSAAVFIKHLPSLEPDAIGFRVKQLVARSVPGMGAQALDRVSAVFVQADAVPQRAPEPPDRPSMVAALGALLGLACLGAGAAFLLRQRGWKPLRGLGSASSTPPAGTPTPAAALRAAVPSGSAPPRTGGPPAVMN